MTQTILPTTVDDQPPWAPPLVAPDELHRRQLARAWEVVEQAAAANPFYGPRLAALPAARTAAAFRRLPVTTKADVVDDCEAFPPYGSRTACADAEVRQVVETSGTSGNGREVYALDAGDVEAVDAAEALGFWWAGARAGSRVLLTLPVGTAAAGLWYYGGLRLIGANVLSVGAYPTERKVAVLRRYGADLVVGTPSYLQRLAVACAEAGVDPSSLGVRSLVVAGEAYRPGWARRLEELWAATLYEQYGCTERAMAWACPGGVLRDGDLGVLHFPPDLAYVEVVDPDTGEPCADGETGELVTTTLQASASPLVRFATRDRVEYVAPGSCGCGRPLAGIRAGGVQRYDDMLKIRGVNVWPAHFDAAVFAVPAVVDYRGTVTRAADGSEVVALAVERATAEGDDDLPEQVAGSVRAATGLGVEVAVVAPGAISGSVPEGFLKVSRWRDLRNEAASDEAAEEDDR